METTCNNVANNIFDPISINNKVAIANCQLLLSPNENSRISNTEIVVWINDLHKALDENHETGIQINHLGKKTTFYIDHIAHKNHAMIYFKGQTVSGRQVHFVKHLSDLRIKLKALVSRSPSQEKTPFGFSNWQEHENEKSRLALD